MYVSNEDYRKDGPAPADEKAERQRIFRVAGLAKLSTGTVHVYILDPGGRPIDSQHVAVASKVERLTEMLESAVAQLGTRQGEPLVKPSEQAAAPPAKADVLRLHLSARYLTRTGGEDVVPKRELGQTQSSGWGAYPGENWVLLHRAEWTRLLPAADAAAGTSWEIDREVAAKLLNYFYPPTENNDVKKNRIDALTLKATVVSRNAGVARVRLDGRLTMKHPFYHKDDDNVVETDLVGFLDCEPSRQRMRALQLVTNRATYGKRPFGVAAWLVP